MEENDIFLTKEFGGYQKEDELEQKTLQPVKERSDMQKKQKVWIECLTQLQEELKIQEEEWRRNAVNFLELENAYRDQEQAALQLCKELKQEKESHKVLQDKLDKAEEQESRLQKEIAESRAENERLRKETAKWLGEKEILISEKERLKAECGRLRELVQNRDVKLRRLQETERIAEQLKRSNHGLMERCRRLEGERRKNGLNGMLEKLVPAARLVIQEKRAGITIPAETPKQGVNFSAAIKKEAEAAISENTVLREEDASDELPAEEESAEQLYRRHTENVNRSIISAQEKIARLLQELQTDFISDEKDSKKPDE